MRFRILLAPVLFLTACPVQKPVERPYAAPKADELFAAIRDRARKVTSLRAETRVDHRGEGSERIKVTISMMVASGGKLRLEAQAPIGGGTVLTVASDGATFQLYDSRNNRFLEGPAKACNVARFIRIELAPEEVVAVLTGGAPIHGEPVGVDWDGSNGGREVLTLKTSDGGSEVLKLDAKDRHWDLLSAERKDASGRILWTVTHSDFEEHEGVRLPRFTNVAQPQHKADARIKFKAVEPNVPVKDDLFKLTPPDNIKIEPADC